jgi:excisionase family DNA binding protein
MHLALETLAMKPPLAKDLLHGADQIAGFLGVTRRAVYHLAEKGKVPIFRMGAKLCARKTRLLAWIEEQETRASAQQD